MCADRLRAPAKGEGVARCVAYEARGYKQAGQTDRRARADMQADGPNRAKIAHSRISALARQYNSSLLLAIAGAIEDVLIIITTMNNNNCIKLVV